MKPLRTLVREIADRAGYIAERKSADNTAAIRRARLLDSLGITGVLDVGANVGVYGRELREHGYRGRIVSFEPLSAAFERLQATAAADPAWEARRLALGDADGESELNVAASDPWSSLLRTDPRSAEPERLATTGTERVPTARLDSLEDVLTERTWLKLDVQGFELQALRGAEGVLGRISAVECEVSLEPFYEGQPTIRDVIDFLDDHGFQLVAVDNGWLRENGRARWMDGIYVLEPRRRYPV